MADRKSLKHVRASLGLSQAQLAILADVSKPTVNDAEAGRKIRLTTAYALMYALNDKLRQRGQGELGLGDLDWNVEE